MADLVRIAPLDISATGDDVETGFTNDDTDIKNIYTILNKVRGLYYGSTAPQNPNLGDLWHKSTDGKIYSWDGDSFEQLSFDGGDAATVAGYEVGNAAGKIPVLNAQGKLPEANTLGYVLIGGIIMWDGALDGTNTYPVKDGVTYTDWQVVTTMQGRFPLGANDTYPLNSTGGEATHVLTVNEMPSHNHSGAPGTEIYMNGPAAYVSGYTNNGTSGNTGGDQPHNNMPPYRAIHFIQRIA
jgi:hypothetical protein